MSTRTVLVTGAGRGIGRAIAVGLARSGWRVHGGVRTDVAAKELAAESDLRPFGVQVGSSSRASSTPTRATRWTRLRRNRVHR